MTDQANPATGATGQVQPTIRVAGQYIKDMSFENPHVGKMLDAPIDNPQLAIEVNVNARQAAEGMFESVLHFTANATSNGGALYKLELEYGGMFKIENMPQQAIEPFLLINAPSLLFPFVRRLVADITREGGFPPVMLDPIDFAALFIQRKQAAQPANANGATKTS